jgi:protocatechuate 3,4-dioxygenase, alpha subunit
VSDAVPTPTPSQTSGPLFGFALMWPGCEEAVSPETPDACVIDGKVIEGDGEPLAYPDCFIEVWNGEQWARTRTDPEGRWRVVVRKPAPAHTPDGELLAPCLNVTLFGRGLLKQAQTRMYFPDEQERNERDAILRLVPESRRGTLIAQPSEEGLRFDIRLQGDDETVFFEF